MKTLYEALAVAVFFAWVFFMTALAHVSMN